MEMLEERRAFEERNEETHDDSELAIAHSNSSISETLYNMVLSSTIISGSRPIGSFI